MTQRISGPAIDFWYEFASTYSYLAAMRVEERAAASGVRIRWRPFLLGPIFRAQGWDTSPFNLFPAKGRNMWRDMERQCAAHGLPFVRPDPFPQNGLVAARLALIGADEGWAPAFSKAVYTAHFGAGGDLISEGLLREALEAAGQDPAASIERAGSPEVKQALKEQVARAMELGLYGAPSFLTRKGELFWGNDRLETALEWAAREHEGREETVGP